MGDGITSVGTIFKMGTTAGALTEVVDLLDFPDLMGSADKIETTTMKDTQRRYRPGLKDPGDMVFNFLYSGMGTGTNWDALKTAEAAGTVYYFAVVFPGGSGFTWSGTVSLSMPGKGIGEALQFAATIMPASAVTPAPGSGGGSQSVPNTLEDLDVTSYAGTTAGDTILAIDPDSAGAGYKYIYLLSDEYIPFGFGEELTGWDDYVSDVTDIATDGETKATVAKVSSTTNLAVGRGIAVLNINQGD